MIVSSSGYFATGSSAVYDLLLEYDCFSAGKNLPPNYEHVPFYTPGGLFDLEDKLLIGNSIHRSDEAIHTFLNEMRRLDENDFRWFGGYKKITGNKYKELYSSFIEELIDFRVDAHWSYHIKKETISIKRALKNTIRLLRGNTYRGGFAKKYQYRVQDQMYYAFPSPQKFYDASSRFILNYFSLFKNNDDKSLLMNHAFLPHNLYRLTNYYLPNTKIIVVDRDPRDVYVYIKYGYDKRGIKSRIPTSIDDFIKFWNLLRLSETKTNSDAVLYIQFEDLIYKYNDTVETIEKFLSIDDGDHRLKKFEHFDPTKSIQNTKLFLADFVDQSEIVLIEEKLGRYLYPFPDSDTSYLSTLDDMFFGNAQERTE